MTNKLGKSSTFTISTRPSSAAISSQETEFKVKALRSQLNFVLMENENLKDDVKSLKKALNAA